MTIQSQDLIAPTGNVFIDTLSQVSGIFTQTAGSVLSTGGTFLDKLTAWKIAQNQSKADPVYIPPTVSNLTPSGTLSKVLVGAGVVGAIGIALYVVLK